MFLGFPPVKGLAERNAGIKCAVAIADPILSCFLFPPTEHHLSVEKTTSINSPSGVMGQGWVKIGEWQLSHLLRCSINKLQVQRYSVALLL